MDNTASLAKARIVRARQLGKTPDPKDVRLVGGRVPGRSAGGGRQRVTVPGSVHDLVLEVAGRVHPSDEMKGEAESRIMEAIVAGEAPDPVDCAVLRA